MPQVDTLTVAEQYPGRHQETLLQEIVRRHY